MRRTALLSFLFVTSALAAWGASGCSSSVSCDNPTDCGSGAGGAGAGGAPGTTPGGAGGAPLSSPVAVVYGTDPVKLRIATFALDCSAPDKDPPYSMCGWFTFELTMPASMLVPGTVAFTDPQLSFFESESGPSSGESCGGGSVGVSTGGAGMAGTMNITSVDAESVTLELQGVNVIDTGMDPNGIYTAPRCP